MSSHGRKRLQKKPNHQQAKRACNAIQSQPENRVITLNPSNFPQLVLEHILSSMETVEIIALGECSKKTATSIRRALLQVESPTMPKLMNITIHPTKSSITLFRNSSFLAHRFEWKFVKAPLPKFMIKMKKKAVIPPRPSGCTGMRRDGHLYTTSARNMDDKLGLTINDLLYIFPSCKVQSLIITVDKDYPNFKASKALGSVVKVEDLTITGETFQSDYERILNKIEATKALSCSAKFFSGGRITNALQCTSKIMCRNSSWITSQKFLNLRAKEIFLDKTRLRQNDLISFVKKWMDPLDNTLDEVVNMSITHPLWSNQLDLSQFNGQAYDPTRRAQFFNMSDGRRIDCQHGIDIERGDGLLATIVEVGSLNLLFMVWRNRFPAA